MNFDGVEDYQRNQLNSDHVFPSGLDTSIIKQPFYLVTLSFLTFIFVASLILLIFWCVYQKRTRLNQIKGHVSNHVSSTSPQLPNSEQVSAVNVTSRPSTTDHISPAGTFKPRHHTTTTTCCSLFESECTFINSYHSQATHITTTPLSPFQEVNSLTRHSYPEYDNSLECDAESNLTELKKCDTPVSSIATRRHQHLPPRLITTCPSIETQLCIIQPVDHTYSQHVWPSPVSSSTVSRQTNNDRSYSTQSNPFIPTVSFTPSTLCRIKNTRHQRISRLSVQNDVWNRKKQFKKLTVTHSERSKKQRQIAVLLINHSHLLSYARPVDNSSNMNLHLQKSFLVTGSNRNLPKTKAILKRRSRTSLPSPFIANISPAFNHPVRGTSSAPFVDNSSDTVDECYTTTPMTSKQTGKMSVSPFAKPNLMMPLSSQVSPLQKKTFVPSQSQSLGAIVTGSNPTHSNKKVKPIYIPHRHHHHHHHYRHSLYHHASYLQLALKHQFSKPDVTPGTNIVTCQKCRDLEQLSNASLPLTLHDLKSKLKNNSAALFQEFWDIPMNHADKKDIPIPGIGHKNRYQSILPNFTTRVVLPMINNDISTSYINANYIRGYCGRPNAFIATQAPMLHTITDFWRMVWFSKSPVIVMMTKLSENNDVKCELYLPNLISEASTSQTTSSGERSSNVNTNANASASCFDVHTSCSSWKNNTPPCSSVCHPDSSSSASPKSCVSNADKAYCDDSDLGPSVDVSQSTNSSFQISSNSNHFGFYQSVSLPGSFQTYGDISVRVLSLERHNDYFVRRLQLTHNLQLREVVHFWYLAWPDHSSPAAARSLLQLVHAVQTCYKQSNLHIQSQHSHKPVSLATDSKEPNISYMEEPMNHTRSIFKPYSENVETPHSNTPNDPPIIVHCCAGLGRTGCFIALSLCCEQLRRDGIVDVLKTTSQLRMDRGGMIQGNEQYAFIHHAILVDACENTPNDNADDIRDGSVS